MEKCLPFAPSEKDFWRGAVALVPHAHPAHHQRVLHP